MIDDYYGTAWICYVVASLGLLLVFWFMTRALWGNLANVLRILFAALLLTPWTASIEQGDGYLAPAIMVSMFEGLNDGPEFAMRGAYPILSVMLLALLMYTIYVVGKMVWAQRANAQVQPRRQPHF